MSRVPPSRGPAADDHLGERLSSLVDGELTPDETASAKRHLARCRACSRELEDVERTRGLLRGLDEPKPPDSFLPGLVRQHRRLTFIVAVVSVIVGVAAALAFALSPPRPSVTPPVNRFERIHATSTPNPDPITEMAPVGVSTTATGP